jgi:hypothetical protein
MKIHEQLELFKRVEEIIRRKATGGPDQRTQKRGKSRVSFTADTIITNPSLIYPKDYMVR